MAENTQAAVKKKQKKPFWSGLKAEWQKIVWTGKQDLAKQTGLVFVVSVIVILLVTAVDSGALAVIEKIM